MMGTFGKYLYAMVMMAMIPSSFALLNLEQGPQGKWGAFQYYNASLDVSNPPPLIGSAFEKLDKLLETVAVTTNAPSLSFGIVYDQELVYYKGWAPPQSKNNKNPHPQPTAESIYRIGSITKVWTVLIAFVMRERGLISLDDAIFKFNNNFTVSNPWGITAEEMLGHSLTIRQLASQVSGLQREAPCVYFRDCQTVDTNEIFRRLTNESLLHPTDVQPSYSNLAYAILGNILSEYRGDATYNQTLFELVLEPLGLNNTGMYLNSDQKKFATPGYEDNQEVPYVDIGWVGPAGNSFSSVNDLATLMKQFFASYPSQFQQKVDEHYNFLLSPQTLREMMRPMFWNPDGLTGFGSPWELRKVGSHLVRSKGGNINGFSSSFAMIPEMKLGVIALSNYDCDESTYTFSALELLVPVFEAWMEEMRVATFHDEMPKAYKEYIGDYTIGTQLFFQIYEETASGNLMVYGATGLLYGMLTWKGGEDMVYNHLSETMSSSCFDATLSAAVGSTIHFVRGSNGSIVGAQVEGLFYNMIFPKKQNGGLTRHYTENKIFLSKSMSKKASMLRGQYLPRKSSKPQT